jgi:hypothetical protein
MILLFENYIPQIRNWIGHAYKAKQNKPGICELWNSFAVDDDTVAHNYSAERRQEKV